MPKIIDIYGREAFDFRKNSIVVNIPFNKKKIKYSDESHKFLSPRRRQILEEIRSNPNVTQVQLSVIVGMGLTAVEKNIRFLKENGYIERIGANKTGYWKVKTDK